MIIVKPNKNSSFRRNFQCSTSFDSSTFPKMRTVNLVGIAKFTSRSCKLFVFVGRFSFTIVPSQGTRSVSVKCLLSANGTRHRLEFFLRKELVLLSSNRKSKGSSSSLGSKPPVTFSFDPQSTNQQQRNCPNSSLRAPRSQPCNQELGQFRC